MALNREQRLFPHFGEAGAALFAIEQVEYGRHDPTPVVLINAASLIGDRFRAFSCPQKKALSVGEWFRRNMFKE